MTTSVQKYGGSSLATIDKMKQVAEKISVEVGQGKRLVVVVSAMGKTTNQLLEIARSTVADPSPRELDMLLATGEQTSAALLAMLLIEKGLDALALSGGQAGLRTFGTHLKSKVQDVDVMRLEEHLAQGKTVVVAGFQGLNEAGDITTLGRGGGDTTAVAIAARLGCPCEIYTDVAGVYSVDPRRYPLAAKLDFISYEEMQEMSHLGAKIMEPRSVEIGERFKVPIFVGLSCSQAGGTLIKEHDTAMEERSITGISVAEDVLIVTLKGLPYSPRAIAKVFTLLARAEVLVDMISQTSPIGGFVSLSFTANQADRQCVEKALADFISEYPGTTLTYDEEQTKVSVVGLGMRTQSGVAAKLFNVFAENNIDVKQVSTSEISISYILSTLAVSKAIRAISEAFSLSSEQRT